MAAPLIVVVDDDLAILEMVAEILEAVGYRILTCTTVSAAIDCITRELPKLAIVDLWIEPHADGWVYVPPW